MQLLLAKIPKGKVTTYGIIARKLKIHPRVAGRLVGSNPDGVRYPCYRVVYSNGEIGGYTSPDGVRDKIRKLKRDGIEIKKNKIDLKKYLFDFHR